MSDESTKRPETEDQGTEDQSFEEVGADQQEAETAAEDMDAAGDDSAEAGEAELDAAGKLAATEAELAEKQNEILRLHAEIQNIRRRAEQDVEKAHKYGPVSYTHLTLPTNREV